MFKNFQSTYITTNEANIFFVKGGTGKPLLLLHGYPQTHVAWHKVAPLLVDKFSLIIPDLRGYGDSKGPESDAKHVNYSKRAMADDMVQVMEKLGYQTFSVAGHDRGGRVAYRLALDYPEKVEKLAVLDMVPTLGAVEATDSEAAFTNYHWYFLSQPFPLPETLISNNAKFYLEHTLKSWAGNYEAIDKKALEEYLRCFQKKEVFHAMCEDYRAGLTTDTKIDLIDRKKGNKIICPLLCLWGEQGASKIENSPLTIWKKWAFNVKGHAITSGHFLMEEAPERVAKAFMSFFQK
jgi:haloacetate dehalogenase